MDIEAYISSGILEAYVLGQATAEEAAIVECVAKNNVRVQEAIAELSITLEHFTNLHIAAPPPALKETIQKQLSFPENTPRKPVEMPLPVAIPENPAASRPIFWKSLAVAASVLFLVSAGGYFYSQQQQERAVAVLEKTEKDLAYQKARLDFYQAKENIMAQPGMELVMLQGVEKHPEAKAVVMWNRENKSVFLDVLRLPEAPAGRQYQLWAMVNGKPVSAGLYNGRPLQPLSTVNTAEAFAITLENEGGVTSPTLENLMVMGAVKG